MTTRILPPAEWAQCPAHMRPQLLTLDPTLVRVVVVEELGDIIGCVVLARTVVADGLWIAPVHRGRTSVARRLLAGMQVVAEGDLQSRSIVGHGMCEAVTQMMVKLGGTPLAAPSIAIPLQPRTASCP